MAQKAVFVSEGARIDYTPGSAVAEGDVVVLGCLVCIATQDIAANTLGALAIEGVFDVQKVTGALATVGVALFWDEDGNPVGRTAGTGALTTNSALGNLAGFLVAAATETGQTARIKLAHAAEDLIS